MPERPQSVALGKHADQIEVDPGIQLPLGHDLPPLRTEVLLPAF